MLPKSLSLRLLIVTSVWTVFALVLTGIVLSTVFRRGTEQNFENLLLAHAYNLMGAIDVKSDGNISGVPNLGDPRFLSPLSGWYWTVSTAEEPGIPLINSTSISGDTIEVKGTNELPFNDQFRRSYRWQEENGDSVQRLEAQLFLGEGDTLYQISLAGNRDDMESAIQQFNNSLWLFFCLFGIGTLLATFFINKLGLRPLLEAKRALADVREGRSKNLDGVFPTEIDPLVNEINALIGANQSVIERSRTQVGNLAHALKTPLAVIVNELRKPDERTNERIGSQTEAMQSHIQKYLQRARVAAQQGVLTMRTPVEPVLQSLIRVMAKLSPSLNFELVVDFPDAIFLGEKQDLEELLGNLLENASRFAANGVRAKISYREDGIHGRPAFIIAVDDDGPGMPKESLNEALERGKRLDESQPGSGLGLSIVQDIVSEYGGDLQLGESDLGGLCVAIYLPSKADAG